MPVTPTVVELVTRANMLPDTPQAKACYNVYHFRRNSIVPAFNKTHIESAFNTAIQATVALALQQDYVQYATDVRFPEDATDAYLTISRANTGAITTAASGKFVAVALQFKSGLRGRSFRGSKHYTPIAEADSAGDVLTSGAITRFTAIKTAILAGFTDADGNAWLPVILSGTLSQLKTNPTTVIVNPVVTILLNTTMGTMRRRKVKTVAV